MSVDTISAYVDSLPPGFQDSQVALLGFNAQTDDFKTSGFVASVDDVAARSVTAYVAPDFTSEAAFQKIATSFNVSLSFHEWSHNWPDLNAASERIINAPIGAFGDGFKVDSVVVFDPAFDGLIVRGHQVTADDSVLPGVTAPDPSSGIADKNGASASLSRARLAATTGINVSVVESPAPVLADGSRQSDSKPFYGGGIMSRPSGSFCSSGSSVVLNGTARTTTARHCTANDYQAPNNTGAKYGTTAASAAAGQGRVMTGTGDGRVWDGAWNSNGYSKAVHGFASLSVGDYVCTDGGNSGAHCNAKITKAVSWNDGYGSATNFEATVSSGIAAIQGDSGGPVLVPLSNGTQVYAAGMIQYVTGTNLNPNCGGTYYTGSNDCTRTVGFTSMRTVVGSVTGMTLKVS